MLSPVGEGGESSRTIRNGDDHYAELRFGYFPFFQTDRWVILSRPPDPESLSSRNAGVLQCSFQFEFADGAPRLCEPSPWARFSFLLVYFFSSLSNSTLSVIQCSLIFALAMIPTWFFDSNGFAGDRSADQDKPAVVPRLSPCGEIQFTVYRPKSVRPNEWYPLLAFAHLADRRPGACNSNT